MLEILEYQGLNKLQCWLKPEYSQKVKGRRLCNVFLNTETQTLESGNACSFHRLCSTKYQRNKNIDADIMHTLLLCELTMCTKV